MITQNVLNTLQLSLLNADRCSISDWNYSNVTSPFSRLYLINEGEGSITHGNKKYTLKAGHLYLIPSFISCDYSTSSYIDHYYIHFTPRLAGGLNIYNILEFGFEISASREEIQLVERYIKLNPGKKLKETNPNNYPPENLFPQNKDLYKRNSVVPQIEANGILLQLFSRFIKSGGPKRNNKDLYKENKLEKVVNYIHQNLDKDIDISDLSSIYCCSNDYFSRLFYKVMGIRPVDYINQKRIEFAQLRLTTSDDPIEYISIEVGVNNYPYFNRLFKKYTKYTPGEYRKNYQFN